MEGGAWKAAVHGVAEDQTQLKDFTFTFLEENAGSCGAAGELIGSPRHPPTPLSLAFLSLSLALQNGNTALAIAKRLGYISVVDTLKVVTEEVTTILGFCQQLLDLPTALGQGDRPVAKVVEYRTKVLATPVNEDPACGGRRQERGVRHLGVPFLEGPEGNEVALGSVHLPGAAGPRRRQRPHPPGSQQRADGGPA